MKRGDYIKYDSYIHGKGSAQILDIIERDGKQLVICEPLYSNKQLRNEREFYPLIELDINECQITEKIIKHQILRFR